MAAKTTASPATESLRKDPMMAHLMDSLDAGKDIGHYGRLVFTMVARHFLSDAELSAELGKDRDFSPEAARELLDQVTAHDYNPPRREKILEYQSKQDFPILPNPEDPGLRQRLPHARIPRRRLRTHRRVPRAENRRIALTFPTRTYLEAAQSQNQAITRINVQDDRLRTVSNVDSRAELMP